MKPLTKADIVRIVEDECSEAIRAADQLNDHDRRVARLTMGAFMLSLRARLPHDLVANA